MSEYPYWRDPEYKAALRKLNASVRPYLAELLAKRGLTRDDMDRALRGDRTSPAWYLMEQGNQRRDSNDAA